MCKCCGVFQLFSLSPRRAYSVIFIVLCLFSYSFSKKIRIKKEVIDDSVQRYLMSFGYMGRPEGSAGGAFGDSPDDVVAFHTQNPARNSSDPSTDGAVALRTEESLRDAIKEMQRFAGIPDTGRLDPRTVKLLETPRCGVPDKNIQTSGRRKRFTLHGSKWPYTSLTWSLRTSIFPGLDPYEVRDVLSKALDVWARHSQLNFKEVNSDNADIRIYFYRGPHGDKFPFDGKGVILAHAYFPNDEGRSIDVHFDADESWSTSTRSDEGTNLFNVAVHEFGHSLGLAHSSVEDALMYPWYKDKDMNGFEYQLPEDDKLAVQALYGARTDYWNGNGKKFYPARERNPVWTTTTTTTTTTTPRTYPTRPSQQWPYNPRSQPPVTKYPYPPYKPQHPSYPHKPHYKPHIPKNPMRPEKKPQHPFNRNPQYPVFKQPERTTTTTTPRPDDHPERRHHYPDKESPSEKPPDTCDTSYDSVAVIRREVFIFKDAYFWRIGDDGRLLPNYPAKITRLWRGLPHDLSRVDAVYERPDNKIVFFIDDKFYVFTGNVLEPGYPQPLTLLGLPATLRKIDGAMVWGHNGKTYFYSGSMYWRFDEDERKVELDYPRDMSMWKGVGTDIDAVFQWKDGRTYFFKGKGFWKFNDLHMRVEHVHQKPSAPFWMGCTSNLEGNDIGEKLPFKHASSSPSLLLDDTVLWLSLIIGYFYFKFYHWL